VRGVAIRLLGDPSKLPPGGVVRQIPPSQRTSEGLVQVLPNLSPGTWRLLLPRGLENRLLLLTGDLPQALATFEVVPGQTVVVEAELPEP